MTQTRTRKSAEARKAQIVETAIRLSADQGPDRLTTEKLAREVGISQAGIFRHFATKADIWLAVGQSIGCLMTSDMVLEGDTPVAPVDKLRNLVIKQLSFIEKTPAIPAILFSQELHAENEPLRLHFAGMMANRQALFVALIEAEKTRGGFHADLNAADAAGIILALIQGLAMRWSLNARDFDLVAEGERWLELQLRGFGNTD